MMVVTYNKQRENFQQSRQKYDALSKAQKLQQNSIT